MDTQFHLLSCGDDAPGSFSKMHAGADAPDPPSGTANLHLSLDCSRVSVQRPLILFSMAQQLNCVYCLLLHPDNYGILIIIVLIIVIDDSSTEVLLH